jgi:hypothetical protein
VSSDKRGVLQFIGVANLIVCALFVIVSVPFFWRQYTVLRTWPVADAQILRSEVVTEPGPGHDQLYSAKLTVLYSVNAKATTAELTSYQSSNYQATQDRVAQFPVGSHHLIRYAPQDPSQVRIGAEWNARFFVVPLVILAMGAVFAVIAALCFMLATRRSTRAR